MRTAANRQWAAATCTNILDWKNEILRQFLTASGIEVVQMQSFAAANPTELGKITSDQVKYDVVDSYAKLMELVK